jgi:hypothetical protein
MTASSAPERSACLNCDFIERPSNARSARMPASRSAWVSSSAVAPPAVSITNTSTLVVGASNTPSASQASRIRSMPRPKPMPGVGGAPSSSAKPS